jgi:hypothetical protein
MILGDGNCFYQAVLDQLPFNHSTPESLRLDVIEMVEREFKSPSRNQFKKLVLVIIEAQAQ